MCLIIERAPNIVLPFDKFKTAILNNPDGYGLSFVEDGRLQTLRSKETPDPDKLYRLINEDLLDTQLLVHLRYNTAGDTSLRNAHPFPILEKAKDGVDLRMAHNGTIFAYKDAAKVSLSDTRNFVSSFARPLIKRMAKAIGPENVLSDPLLKKILTSEAGGSSVLSFLDSEGRTLTVNEFKNGGKREAGVYYSNGYSFNESHRKPVGGSLSNGNPTRPAGGQGRQSRTHKGTYGMTTSTATGVGVKSPSNVIPLNADSLHKPCKVFSKGKGVEPIDLLRLNDSTLDEVIASGAGEVKSLVFELLFLCKDLLDRNVRLGDALKAKPTNNGVSK